MASGTHLQSAAVNAAIKVALENQAAELNVVHENRLQVANDALAHAQQKMASIKICIGRSR